MIYVDVARERERAAENNGDDYYYVYLSSFYRQYICNSTVYCIIIIIIIIVVVVNYIESISNRMLIILKPGKCKYGSLQNQCERESELDR